MNSLTLTRAEIIDKLVRDLNINRVDATRVFEDMLEEIFVAMKDSRCVKISSFGSFNVRQKKPRVGRNPKTGVEAEISGRNVISFKPSHILRERVNIGKK